MKKILAIVTLSVLIISCKTSNDVVSNSLFQKRKYNKGWFVNSKKNVSNKKSITKNFDVALEEEKEINKENPISKTKGDNLAQKQPKSEESIIKELSQIDLDNKNQKEKIKVKVVNTPKKSFTYKDITSSKKEPNTSSAKKLKAKKAGSQRSGGATFGLIVLAILIPFLAAGIATKWKDDHWLWALVLSLLGWIPGAVYAIVIITRN